jgi:AraC-like DNA-binding protein
MSETRQHQPAIEPAVTLSRRLAGGAVIDAHRHDGNQIVYASQGVLSVTTDAGTWVAPASRAIWIPAGAVHEHRAYGTTVLHTVGLPARADPLRTSAPAVLEVGPLLRELIIAYTRGPQEDSPPRTRLRAVLFDQLRTTPQHGIHLPAARDPHLAAACDLLLRDPADHRSLAELGTAVGISHRTLTRLFRQEMGMTFPQWRTQVRLHLALRLLAQGLPVTTVGHRCGWSTTSAFIDVFRRNLGHTPGRNSPAARSGQLSRAAPA